MQSDMAGAATQLPAMSLIRFNRERNGMSKSQLSARASAAACGVITVVLASQLLAPFEIAYAETHAASAAAQAIQVSDVADDGAGGGSFTLDVNGDQSKVSIEEDESQRTVTVKDEETGEQGYFVYNKQTGEVYSSYTGQTFKPDGVVEEGVGARSTTKRVYYTYSWSTIRAGIGGVSNVAFFVGHLLSLTGSGAALRSAISQASDVLDRIGRVIPNDKKHGVRVAVAITKYFRRGNHIPYRTTKSVAGVTRY